MTRGAPVQAAPKPAFDVARVREDFPALHQQVNGHPLVYLDNAATTQKPRSVLEALRRYYESDNANIHRAVHTLSARATEAYEATRRAVRDFLHAPHTEEIVFVRGTTEAVNLVAQSFGRSHLEAGDEIILSQLEHHSNIVPWQLLCEQIGTIVRVAPINHRGELDFDAFTRLLSPRTRLVAIGHISNALGTINPVQRICAAAREVGARVLIDGAQAAPHQPIDVQEIGCDFYALSSHKMFGPTGVGVLWGRKELLESMPPYQGGGEMIKSVSFERTTYNDLPHKFEAGTPHIAGVVAFRYAIDYLTSLGWDNIAAHEVALLEHATQRLSAIPGVHIVGTAREKASVISFTIDGVHPHDAGTLLDRLGLAVRTGHHCAQPVMDFFGLPATCRASLAFYNTLEEIDALVEGVQRVQRALT